MKVLNIFLLLYIASLSIMIITISIDYLIGSNNIDPSLLPMLIVFLLIVIFGQRKVKKKIALREIEIEDKRKENQEKDKLFREKYNLEFQKLSNLEIIESSLFTNKIHENEQGILEKGGRDALEDLVKIATYSNRISKRIEENYKKIPHPDTYEGGVVTATDEFFLDLAVGFGVDKSAYKPELFVKKFKRISKQFEISVEFNKQLYAIGLTMLELVLNNQKTQYLIIRGELDSLGVFNSEYQNKMLDKLRHLESNLQVVSEQLTSIGNKLNLQNALISLNTYQLSNISKNLS